MGTRGPSMPPMVDERALQAFMALQQQSARNVEAHRREYFMQQANALQNSNPYTDPSLLQNSWPYAAEAAPKPEPQPPETLWPAAFEALGIIVLGLVLRVFGLI
jgi:hypothetical protein